MVQKRKIIHYFYISAIFLISCMNKENKENGGNEINDQYKDTFINTPNSDSILNLIQKTSKINSDSDLNKFENKFQIRLIETNFVLDDKLYKMNIEENVIGLIKETDAPLSVTTDKFYKLFPNGHFGANFCSITALPIGQEIKYLKLAKSIGFNDIGYRCFVEHNGISETRLLTTTLTVKFNDKIQSEIENILKNKQIKKSTFNEVTLTYTVFPKNIAAISIVKLYNWFLTFKDTKTSYNFGSCEINEVPYDN